MVNLAPIWKSQVQGYIFRKLLDGFSFPGRIQEIGELIENINASEAILPVLLDSTVSLADPNEKISEESFAFLNCQKTVAEKARFIIADGKLAPRFKPNSGSLMEPEMGATLILEINEIGAGKTIELSGPGIQTTTVIQIDGLNSEWLSEEIRQRSGFPRGVDLIICDENKFICIPRTTNLEVK